MRDGILVHEISIEIKAIVKNKCVLIDVFSS